VTDRFIIIGRSSCPFCTRAVEYCQAKQREYDFLDYASNPEILQEYKQFHSHSTVPIILANNLNTGYTKKIGGYSELLEYL
tara:strand:- start:504 stop:746 length:243 start_codon:yes stop_codon:yes gene_type:complete